MSRASTKDTKISKKVQLRQQRKKQQTRDRIVIIALVSVAALLIAALIILPNLPVSATNLSQPEQLIRAQVNGTYAGDPNAPVKVEEFGDFNCIHCQEFFSNNEAQLLTEYINTGKVYFHYVPMSFIDQTSATAAQAAYCAMDQGKFFEYHDFLFANYGSGYPNQLLKAIAQSVGLNMNDFNSCYSSGKYVAQVQSDENYATSKGVTGTPTFDVNGTMVGQADVFTQIETALNALKAYPKYIFCGVCAGAVHRTNTTIQIMVLPKFTRSYRYMGVFAGIARSFLKNPQATHQQNQQRRDNQTGQEIARTDFFDLQQAADRQGDQN